MLNFARIMGQHFCHNPKGTLRFSISFWCYLIDIVYSYSPLAFMTKRGRDTDNKRGERDNKRERDTV